MLEQFQKSGFHETTSSKLRLASQHFEPLNFSKICIVDLQPDAGGGEFKKGDLVTFLFPKGIKEDFKLVILQSKKRVQGILCGMER
mmetsp:Transcript_15728/g.37163  ORF Transcript_15728/g.37163 Transcript_15728/m.37163 type:complete len:86 (+) Transcript_15728:932-1189(+)